MLRWFKTVLVYLLLLVFGRKGHDAFVEDVVKSRRPRRYRKRVCGITEELDEVVPDSRDETHFVGFDRNGTVASFKITRVYNQYEYANVSIEIPAIGRFTSSQSRPLNLGRGRLVLKMLEPMFRWRISFSGTMDCHVSGADTEPVHASVSLYWQCLADPFDHWTCSSKWHLAKNISAQKVTDIWKLVFAKDQVWYEQWGEMWGRIEIEGHEPQSIRLKGFRNRRLGRNSCSNEDSVVSLHLIQDNGEHFITSGIIKCRNAIETSFGYHTLPVGENWSTDQSVMEPLGIQRDSIRFPLHISSKIGSFTIDKDITKTIPTIESSRSRVSLTFATYTINGNRGYGVQCHEPLLYSDIQRFKMVKSSTNQLQLETSIRTLTLPFESKYCRQAAFVGGKCANISILSNLHFAVPKGFCLTVQAYCLQVQTNEQLQLLHENIVSRIRCKNLSGLPIVCAEAMAKYTSSPLHPEVCAVIKHELTQVFGNDFEDIDFAIRSSSVSEDGHETSYAGQLETFLNVNGLDGIFQAVAKCWASSFSYQAVEYRRQNGQPVIEPIAVVIQEMVDSEVAGVIFTNDPVTGNSRVMVINAAPGLGENVVSGTCSPDTIRVRRSKDGQDIEIFTSMQANYDEQRIGRETCITKAQTRDICKLGLEVKESFGSPQDIEWAISKGKLYILQTRPITSLNMETEEELIHEFDSPIAMESECLTTCNIGEMFPGAATTLTQDVFIKTACIECGSKWMTETSGSRFPMFAAKQMMTFANKPFINMTASTVQADGFLQDKQTTDISLVGRVLDEITPEHMVTYKGGRVTMAKALMISINANFILMPRYSRWFDEWSRKVNSFTIGNYASSALDLFTSIDENLHVYVQIWRAYVYKISQNIISFGLTCTMLRGKNTKVSRENSADIALLFGHCSNLMTASLPRAMQNLATCIGQSNIKEEFLMLPDDRCHSCLMNAEDTIRMTYEEFLDQHGHRCIKEAEFLEKSWAADPSKLMRALKLLIRQPSMQLQNNDETSEEEALAQLKTPLSWIQRYLIRRVLLGRGRSGVAGREMGKSVSIKTGDVFKRAYWRLADLMVREGRLPDENILFFLTHREIGELIESRSAALIRKARRRMLVFNRQDSFRYQKIYIGRPVPVPESTDDMTSTTSAHGLPIGKGQATGRACVLTSLDDADNIKTGDILICPFTDIGWSPYFPMISGLVTEIGGLLSHGAVVAREVGIPCVVDVTNATRISERETL